MSFSRSTATFPEAELKLPNQRFLVSLCARGIPDSGQVVSVPTAELSASDETGISITEELTTPPTPTPVVRSAAEAPHVG